MVARAPAMVGDAFPKASIGNYKGVMLCNWPKPERYGQKGRA